MSLIALGLAGGAVIAWLSPPSPAPAVEWLATPRVVAPAELLTRGAEQRLSELAPGWQLLLFGYTHCPDICPASLAEVSAMVESMQSAPLRVIFISVDPARDSAQDVARYAQYFHPDFIGVTGDETEIEALAGSLGLGFRVGADGEVAHSVVMSLLDDRGRLRGRLRPGFDRERAAREIADMAGGGS